MTHTFPTHRFSASWQSFYWKAATALVLFVAIGKAFASEPVDVQTVATGLQYSEGTIFVGDTLYFVDYNASDVLRLAKNGAVQRVWHQDGCAANGLVQTGTRLLVACYDSGTIAEITQDGRLIDTIRSDDKGVPFVYPNDLTADRKGGVYFTASGSAVTPGKVYYRGADRRVREVASNIRYSNGLAVSPNGKRLYVAESEANRLLVYSIAEDGGLSERQVFVDLGQLLATQEETAVTPDGVRVDRNGNVFVALYRGGGFAVFSPGGTLLRSVKLPGEHHTNLAISPDGKAVFVTAIHDTSYGGESRSELLKVPNPLRE